MGAFIDLTGQQFGRLTAIRRVGTRLGHPLWLCICDCGNESEVTTNCLRSKNTLSCGCIRNERAAAQSKAAGIARGKQLTKHGKAGTRLHNVWKAMRERCNNPNDQYYADYGGRGVSVCGEWDDFQIFYDWAMSQGYNPNAPFGECTIDRKDVNGNYCPDNCHWVDMKAQAGNRRPKQKGGDLNYGINSRQAIQGA